MTAREYLFSLEQIGIKLGLDQIRLLLRALDAPDRAFPSIIVAGTNGKGSVTAMIERGLRAAGYRTGRYTSPHLTTIEERVAIDGTPIGAEAFDRLAERIRGAAASLPHPPSFFEATTALALDAFREARVDVAVLEVGLGGRLDATNAVTPVLAVITAIALDHQQYLGDSIEAIAAEKAGIIKPAVVTVLGANPASVRAVVERTAADRGAPIVYAPDGVTMDAVMAGGLTSLSLTTPAGVWPPITLGLRGRHQIDNAVTAARALETLDASGILTVPARAREAALTRVVWPARLEMRQWRRPAGSGDQPAGSGDQPAGSGDQIDVLDILIDGAHNPAGASALAAYLAEAYGRPVPIVFGAMQDKDVSGIVRALVPAASAFICTAAQTPRAARPDALAQLVREAASQVPVVTAKTPESALSAAAPFGVPIVVAGSLYLAGEIREFLS